MQPLACQITPAPTSSRLQKTSVRAARFGRKHPTTSPQNTNQHNPKPYKPICGPRTRSHTRRPTNPPDSGTDAPAYGMLCIARCGTDAQGLRQTSPHAVSIATCSSGSDTEPIAPTITGRRDSPDIIGGCAGRPVSAGAALAVSVTVQAVRIHTDHENGYGFLRGGQVTTVERVAFHVGDTRTVIRMASLFGSAGGGRGGHSRCRQCSIGSIVGTIRDDAPQSVSLGGVHTEPPPYLDMDPRRRIPATLRHFGWQPSCGILRTLRTVRPGGHPNKGMLVTKIVSEPFPVLRVPAVGPGLPRFFERD